MKKEYKKPELLFDSFELSTNIASETCQYQITLAEKVCAVVVPGIGKVFIESSGCDYPGNNVCYHVPEAGNNVFSS